MKVLKKIKLNQLSKVELEKREMDALKGGNDCGDCTCSCYGGCLLIVRLLLLHILIRRRLMCH